MPKICENSYSKTWICKQHEPQCCWSHMTMFKDKDDKYGEIYIGILGWTAEDYYRGWKGRLRAIWDIFRGRPICGDHYFNDRESAEQFRNDLNEAITSAFGKKKPISYGE